MGELSKQIDGLKRYIQIHGEDEFLRMTLSKMIKVKIESYSKELKEMEKIFLILKENIK